MIEAVQEYLETSAPVLAPALSGLETQISICSEPPSYDQAKDRSQGEGVCVCVCV